MLLRKMPTGPATLPCTVSIPTSPQCVAFLSGYLIVTGTADSTRPSPLPIQRKNYPTLEDKTIQPDSPHPLPVPVRVGDVDASQEAIPIPHSLSRVPSTKSPWDPASPQTLARLLADISPRHSPAIVPQTDEEEEDELSPPFESSSSEVLETPSPSNGLGLTDVEPDVAEAHVGNGHVVEPELQENEEADDIVFDETNLALQDSIRGLYALWKASRRKGNLESDRDAFMRVVEKILA